MVPSGRGIYDYVVGQNRGKATMTRLAYLQLLSGNAGGVETPPCIDILPIENGDV